MLAAGSAALILALLPGSPHAPRLASLSTRGISATRLPASPLCMSPPDDGSESCVDEVCDVSKEVEQEDEGWEQYMGSSSYSEESRKYRRTVYMHKEWVEHRASDRFYWNMVLIGKSGVVQSLGTELAFITFTSIFIVLANMGVAGYQDFSGVMHPGPLSYISQGLEADIKSISLPTMPFTISMPALSLLLVFRTNTAYARWNEARTLWGGVVNTCRNVVRQANIFFPEDDKADALKDTLAANTALFAKCLRNFLRGPSDDPQLRLELSEAVDAGVITQTQLTATMEAKNRPMFAISAMSQNLRQAKIGEMDRARIDTSISTLVDLTGACERIFKSPVPLVYTRHTSRFLTTFLLFLPLGVWPTMADTWNHWATVPVTDAVAFFLLGIEEIGIQIEEPFSILPLEALCNGAIAATMEEMVNAKRSTAFDLPEGKKEKHKVAGW